MKCSVTEPPLTPRPPSSPGPSRSAVSLVLRRWLVRRFLELSFRKTIAKASCTPREQSDTRLEKGKNPFSSPYFLPVEDEPRIEYRGLGTRICRFVRCEGYRYCFISWLQEYTRMNFERRIKVPFVAGVRDCIAGHLRQTRSAGYRSRFIIQISEEWSVV